MGLISFFDVSIAQNQGSVTNNGNVIDVNDLIKARLIQQPSLFKNTNLLDSIKPFDVYGVEKPTYWERAISTIIYCLSGQIPDRQEVLRGRQIICQLPRWFKKKHLNEQFVLGFLPYILIGFKTHLENCFQPDSNRIHDVCNFISSVYGEENVKMVSFLCAHRGFSVKDSHSLIDAVHQQKAKKTLNLQKAILVNIPRLRSRKICWYQQGPTAMASSNMFPEMFIEYLVAGNIPDLLLLLEKHFSEVDSLLREDTSRLIDAGLADLDIFTNRTCAFLNSQYGTDWRITDFESRGIKRTPLVELALNQVIPGIKRLIPFYGNSLTKNFLETRLTHLKKNLLRAQKIESEGIVSDIILRTIKAIDWFYYNQLMHTTAKALYEAAFYYVWGQTTASQNDEIAIGIDRDHAEYQNSAWNMGYYSSALGKNKPPTAILYARRAESENPGGILRDISFRQFWR